MRSVRKMAVILLMFILAGCASAFVPAEDYHPPEEPYYGWYGYGYGRSRVDINCRRHNYRGNYTGYFDRDSLSHPYLKRPTNPKEAYQLGKNMGKEEKQRKKICEEFLRGYKEQLK